MFRRLRRVGHQRVRFPGAAAMRRPDDEVFQPADRIGLHLVGEVPKPRCCRIRNLIEAASLFAVAGSPDGKRILPDVPLGACLFRDRCIGHAYCSRALSSSPAMPRGLMISTRMMNRNWVISTYWPPRNLLVSASMRPSRMAGDHRALDRAKTTAERDRHALDQAVSGRRTALCNRSGTAVPPPARPSRR